MRRNPFIRQAFLPHEYWHGICTGYITQDTLQKEEAMKFSRGLIGIAFTVVCLMRPPLAHAVDVGQIDTFEDGTTQGWLVGLLGAPHPAPPINVPTGGPAGAGDNYLLLTAVGGGGPGNRLTVLNLSQWTGNYLAAGVTSIRMDVNNLGGSDLALRLLFENPMGGPPTDMAFSADPIFLPAGSGWTPVEFLVDPGHLTAAMGSVNTVLANTTALRLFHSPAPGYPGPSVVAQLGVDNITALPTAVPEPSTAAILGVGLMAFLARRRLRVKQP
jgi:hypothetical protein